MNYDLGDKLILKKPHPCFKRSKEFEVIRMGADIRIRCLGCNKTFLLPRADLEAKIDQIIKKK